MSDGSEFHTVGAAILKPREAKVVRTRGTDNRLMSAASVENVWGCGNSEGSGGKRADGTESVVGQRGKLEFYALSTPTSTTATFVAAVNPGTRISFPFARCRYLSNLNILLVIIINN